jgi:LmbE family N-acetylglucosaminyl deacetylase
LSALAFVGALTATVVGVGGLLILQRHRAYRRRVSYDPGQSLVLGMGGPTVEAVPVRCEENGFVLPETATKPVSGFLELEVKASIAGRLSDPAVEIRAGDFSDIQYLERGAQGTRFLNVSRLLRCKTAGERVHLNGRGLTWKADWARLHICDEQIAPDDRVLVIAPHPDDAEIAAFGFYADMCATIVTLTAGDASDRYENSAQPWISFPRNTIAKMRVWDSLSVPQFGGVPSERAINLCLPDGRLREMYVSADHDFCGDNDNALDFSTLRRMNYSHPFQDGSACTWSSLVRELCSIIKEVKPSIVVTPHPTLDPHADHLFATLALSEALHFSGSTKGRMFFYTVHNRRSELWPFGPAGSGVALLPILPEDGLGASGFYSHGLSIQRQRQKFIALEAMHDVRDIQWPPDRPGRQVGRRMMEELRGLAHGMGTSPTSYLRRAVRPDELFFVTSIEDGLALARRAVEGRVSTGAASGAGREFVPYQ